MKPRFLRVLAGLATCGALVAGVSVASAATNTSATKQVTCTLELYAHPQSPTTGFDLGFANCGKPLGDGLQYDTYTITSNGSTLTETGPATQLFDKGSVHGEFNLSVMTSIGTATGTFTLTGGTGAFEPTDGSGTLSCTFSSATQVTCIENASFTHL